jgi:hypothetical protein
MQEAAAGTGVLDAQRQLGSSLLWWKHRHLSANMLKHAETC